MYLSLVFRKKYGFYYLNILQRSSLINRLQLNRGTTPRVIVPTQRRCALIAATVTVVTSRQAELISHF